MDHEHIGDYRDVAFDLDLEIEIENASASVKMNVHDVDDWNARVFDYVCYGCELAAVELDVVQEYWSWTFCGLRALS